MSRHLEVHVTASSREEAQSIIDAAVESRTAACAQISGPISSTYWWQGEIQRDEEFLILMKTTKERLDDLVEVVRSAHSYDTPEIVAVPIEGGLADYLNWITEETAVSSPDA
ncbi:divalent-cation tolerance protein CutA [Actinocorallia sp. API 0066]|uniref:divalent-cation tolerance protein CutA n=1 Tax=Actinocorallia sp. API 0066 TaxID=2896846 RepID=UPI001E528EBE|nr:divalent-cation tolerance protein CutA [Actinocorallia sp. API 0066]MCD0450463.1 divalent-cation tolerance protein CutA [Actinocorallia sp. API 0066]